MKFELFHIIKVVIRKIVMFLIDIIEYFYRIYLTGVTAPYYTVCDSIFKITIVTFIVTFFVTFKHRYKDRRIKHYFFRNNSVTENILSHLPLPLSSVTHT